MRPGQLVETETFVSAAVLVEARLRLGFVRRDHMRLELQFSPRIRVEAVVWVRARGRGQADVDGGGRRNPTSTRGRSCGSGHRTSPARRSWSRSPGSSWSWCCRTACWRT
jgi:hypothetical protein